MFALCKRASYCRISIFPSKILPVKMYDGFVQLVFCPKHGEDTLWDVSRNPIDFFELTQLTWVNFPFLVSQCILNKFTENSSKPTEQIFSWFFTAFSNNMSWEWRIRKFMSLYARLSSRDGAQVFTPSRAGE